MKERQKGRQRSGKVHIERILEFYARTEKPMDIKKTLEEEAKTGLCTIPKPTTKALLAVVEMHPSFAATELGKVVVKLVEDNDKLVKRVKALEAQVSALMSMRTLPLP